MKQKMLLENVDHDKLVAGLFETIRAEHFRKNLPIIRAESDEPNCEWYIREFPNGDKERLHVSNLNG